ncbi:MAG: multidrug efflux pump [Gammaproteobacteria bacterium]|jgi:multidrug efflux pump
MNKLINAAFIRPRAVMMMMVSLLIAGYLGVNSIPKENFPDITLPMFVVSVVHPGISPEDGERLIAKPLELELETIEGVKQISSVATEGLVEVMIELEFGSDTNKALAEVRAEVDSARAELPADSQEPTIKEFNSTDNPVVRLLVGGDLSRRAIYKVANALEKRLEEVPGVLGVDLVGKRDEQLEIIVDPAALDHFKLPMEEVYSRINRNNLLVAAGSLSNQTSQTTIKVPGVIDDINTLLNIALKTDGNQAVLLGDVATVRRGYAEPTMITRVFGKEAVEIAVRKRIGVSTIDHIDELKAAAKPLLDNLPEGMTHSWYWDESGMIERRVNNLVNSVATGVMLVMIVVVATLGLRSGLLVGLSIPGSFLLGILAMDFLGHSLNQVTLFGLMLSLGLLVDGTIVVIEMADKCLAEGMGRRAAYAEAARRMAWPVISSTGTTVAAFLPLVFWPGMMGQFMSKVPLTVVCVLGMSMLFALLFVPVVGALTGPRKPSATAAVEETGFSLYVAFLRQLTKAPIAVVVIAIVGLAGVVVIYTQAGAGVEFFPETEPEQLYVEVQARGDMSIEEKDRLVTLVEQRVLQHRDNVASIMTAVGGPFQEAPADAIGRINIMLHTWPFEISGKEMMATLKRELEGQFGGLNVSVYELKDGPAAGKPINLEVAAADDQARSDAVDLLREGMEDVGGIVAIEDSRALPGLEWRLDIDRAEASRLGTDVATIGQAVQLVTQGVKVGEYLPDDVDDELDIRVIYPRESRTLDVLDQMRIQTSQGLVPISAFVKRSAAQRVDKIKRVNGNRIYEIKADVAGGYLADTQLKLLNAWLLDNPLPEGTFIRLRGESEEQQEAGEFLVGAMALGIGMIMLILVVQFNSYSQALIVLTAVVFSVVGALIVLLITGQPFGIIMGGMGVVCLAGIVVNNNIVLIDAYNQLRLQGWTPREAVIETGRQRLRPVLLTTVTTGLGLLPMALTVSVDVVNRSYSIGSPDGIWWVGLSIVIIGGLAFATVLTLVVTPCMLLVASRKEREVSESDVRDQQQSAGLLPSNS